MKFIYLKAKTFDVSVSSDALLLRSGLYLFYPHFIHLSLALSLSLCVCVCSNWVLLKQLGGGEQGVCEGLSTRERRGNAPSRLSLNLGLGYGNGSFGFEWARLSYDPLLF